MAASKRQADIVLVVAFIGAMALCGTARAIQFAGGTGEPNDPYQIATAAQLTGIESSGDPELRRKHFILVASIDLGGTTRNEPVIPVFEGTLDGNGWTIRNLRLEGGTMQGLIGLLAPEGEVRNLGLENVSIAYTIKCGALVRDNLGRVFNCYSTGTVVGNYGAGGLVGGNWGTVAGSYSTAAVTSSMDAGGLIGQNSGRISFCHATGDVTGGTDVGGLVGNNMGEISSCYSTAAVTGTLKGVGGLVGTNMGAIRSSYADATVLGYDWYVGGLVGYNRNAVLSCYSAGSVVGEDIVGGLVGINSGGMGRIVTSYSIADVTDHSYSWHIGGLVGAGGAPDNCYFLAPPEGSGPDNDLGTPLTGVEMTQQASFEDWDFWGNDADGRADPWFMPENAYPVLAWQADLTGLLPIPDMAGLTLDEAQATLTAAGFVPGVIRYDIHRTIPADCVIHADPHARAPAGATVDLVLSSGAVYDWIENPGDGTAANPYQIRTAGQVESLGDRPELWDRHFVLSADVDMTGRTYEKALIAPDADRSASGFQGTPFRGTFDGQGHAIRNLTIRHVDDRYDYVGLFGMIGQTGRIEGLNVLDADVEGGSGSSSYVGVLAGYNTGTIADCSATGTIHGGKGEGLVGFTTTSLVNCQADIIRI